MVRRAEVSRRAAEKGLPERSIEHDYCLSWVLIALGSREFLYDLLAFKGGTCLRKVYFPEWRYSEDLDFTAARRVDPARVIEQIEDACAQLRERVGLVASVDLSSVDSDDATLSLNISYVGPLSRTSQLGRIKVDISMDEVVLTPPQRRAVFAEYSDQMECSAAIRAYTLEEICAEKIRSMLQRTEPRDLYDVWRILQEPPEDFADVDLQEMVVQKCIKKRVRFEGFDALLSDERLSRFRRSWGERLHHQIVGLPDFGRVARELSRDLRRLADLR